MADPTILNRVTEPSIHAGWIPWHAFDISRESRLLVCLNEVYRRSTTPGDTWQLQSRLNEDYGNISCVAIAPDQETVLTGMKDGTLALWDTATGIRRSRWQGHSAGTWILDAGRRRRKTAAWPPQGKTDR